jgi:hypothetical protein
MIMDVRCRDEIKNFEWWIYIYIYGSVAEKL